MDIVYWDVIRWISCAFFFFFQAEDGIRDLVRSRGLGDVYKRQAEYFLAMVSHHQSGSQGDVQFRGLVFSPVHRSSNCLLYTSDAADERSSVDLGGRRIIKKKTSVTLHAT